MDTQRFALDATIDLSTFQRALEQVATGVTVITAGTADGRHALTAESVTSLPGRTPTMLICLPTGQPTAVAVRDSGHYAVNVLGPAHANLANRFITADEANFSGVAVRSGLGGLPLLGDAFAHIECRVSEEVQTSTHTVFVGGVVAVDAPIGAPLDRSRRGFDSSRFPSDDQAYRTARDLVLNRRYNPDSVLDPGDLGFDLAAEESSAVYALNRLSAEGLVHRDPHRGYVVVPLDRQLSDESFDACCAIQIGALDTALTTDAELSLSALRASYAGMAAQVVGGRFADFDVYLQHNFGFHRAIVALADNAALQEAFATLDRKSVLSRSFGAAAGAAQDLLDVQAAMLAAIQARDLPAARAAAVSYRDQAKNRVHGILTHTGGRL